MSKIGSDILKRKHVKSHKGELLPPSIQKTTIDFVKKLEKSGIRYLIVGAVPVQFYGRERFSRDVDIALFLDQTNIKFLFKILKSERYRVLYPLSQEHKIEKPENLLDWHLLKLKDLKYEGTLDIHLKPERLGLDKASLDSSKTVELGRTKIIIPAPEDYLITKLISRRPSTHDFEDIMSTLLNQYQVIDWKYLEDKAKELSILHLLNYYKEAVERKYGDEKHNEK